MKTFSASISCRLMTTYGYTDSMSLNGGENGGPSQTRTGDLTIMSRML
jgi:hypothetical protein